MSFLWVDIIDSSNFDSLIFCSSSFNSFNCIVRIVFSSFWARKRNNCSVFLLVVRPSTSTFADCNLFMKVLVLDMDSFIDVSKLFPKPYVRELPIEIKSLADPRMLCNFRAVSVTLAAFDASIAAFYSSSFLTMRLVFLTSFSVIFLSSCYFRISPSIIILSSFAKAAFIFFISNFRLYFMFWSFS